MSKKPTEHKVVKEDTNPLGKQRLWCSCGTRCNPGVRTTAKETWQQHAGIA